MPRYILECDPETREWVASVDGFVVKVDLAAAAAAAALAAELVADGEADPGGAPAALPAGAAR